MYIVETIKKLEYFYGKVALTIGNFEGFHRGHMSIVRTLVQEAKNRGLLPAVLTFKEHPLSILLDKRPEKLSAAHDKIVMFMDEGIELLLYIHFSRQFADLDPLSFLAFLKSTMSPRLYCLGRGFRFGRGNSGDTALLREYGPQFYYELLEVDDVSWGGLPVSSTRIRNEVKKGNFKLVRNLLGKRYYAYFIPRQIDPPVFSSFFPDWALPTEGRFSGCLENVQTGIRADIEIIVSNRLFGIANRSSVSIEYSAFKKDPVQLQNSGKYSSVSSGNSGRLDFSVQKNRLYRFYFNSDCGK